MRETCTSGSVRGGDGDIPTYSALLRAKRRQAADERAPIPQSNMVAEEVKPTDRMQLEQPCQEEPAEQLGKHADRQQEGRPRRDPALAVERDPAAGHDHVDVRVVRHRRAPGVEDGGGADARAEMTGVGGDGEHRLRRRAEQQVVDDRLVVEGDVGDLGGDCEDHVEIADRQQVGLALGEPFARRGALALGAVPIAATIVGDAAVAAVQAAFDVAAERGGAAGLDGRHRLELGETDMTGLRRAPGRPMSPEDVGNLQRGPHRWFSRRRARLPSAV